MAEDPESGGEKTEDPTSRKLTKAREEGQVGKSMEIPSVFVLIAGVISLYASAHFVYRNLTAIMQHNFRFERIPSFGQNDLINMLAFHMEKMVITLSPMMIAIFLIALLSNIAQVGFAISWKAIEPKFSKLDPISGFKQKFTSRAVVEFVKSILKIAIISLVVYNSAKSEMIEISRLYDRSVGQILVFILKESFWIFIKVCLVMLVVALLDYAYQKWKFLNDQKMTKKEVKDEIKQTEGDPIVKSRIRQLQTQAARKRMMAQVPEADVVVTNPTRLAVAIKYDGMVMAAPSVIAKGAGPVAENIRRIARENDIPVIENKELARNLYKTVDIGEEVAIELYQAVAELLAHVYKLKNRSL